VSSFFCAEQQKVDLEPLCAVKEITLSLGGGSLQGLWAGSALTYNRSTLDPGQAYPCA